MRPNWPPSSKTRSGCATDWPRSSSIQSPLSISHRVSTPSSSRANSSQTICPFSPNSPLNDPVKTASSTSPDSPHVSRSVSISLISSTRVLAPTNSNSNQTRLRPDQSRSRLHLESASHEERLTLQVLRPQDLSQFPQSRIPKHVPTALFSNTSQAALRYSSADPQVVPRTESESQVRRGY